LVDFAQNPATGLEGKVGVTRGYERMVQVAQLRGNRVTAHWPTCVLQSDRPAEFITFSCFLVFQVNFILCYFHCVHVFSRYVVWPRYRALCRSLPHILAPPPLVPPYKLLLCTVQYLRGQAVHDRNLCRLKT
jgi:hypothetical protein